jgi:hypothetical protein
MVDTWKIVISQSLVNFSTRDFKSYLRRLSACNVCLCDVQKQSPWQRHCGESAKGIEIKQSKWQPVGEMDGN